MGDASERLRVLEMVAQGKISAAEGAELLDAIGSAASPLTDGAEEGSGPGKARWVRVEVTKNHQTPVNIKIPLGLFEMGLKLAPKRFAAGWLESEDMPEGFNAEEILSAVEGAARGVSRGKIIDLEAEDARVAIFIE